MDYKKEADAIFKKMLTAIAEETMDSDNIIRYNAKQCSLVFVDGVLDIMKEEYFSGSQKITDWQKIKTEIEKL